MLQQPTVTSPFVIIVADCIQRSRTIGEVGASGGSHKATVGQSLTLSCNTAPAVWKKGSVTITNTDTSARVFVMSDSTETMLRFSPLPTADRGTYSCQFNSTFRISLTLSECTSSNSWPGSQTLSAMASQLHGVWCTFTVHCDHCYCMWEM